MAAGKKRSPVPERLPVPRTCKLYIKGAFVRPAAGRTLQCGSSRKERGGFVARIAHASRKDFASAVTAARQAFGPWAHRSAFNRSQILFRMAEMVDHRRAALEAGLRTAAGLTAKGAAEEVSVAADRLFWYAGWADKYSQVLGGANPVAAPFLNITIPEPLGVVSVFASTRSPLVGLVSAVAPVILSGNTAVVMVEGPAPTLAVDFAEVVAVSDVPAGVVNILTGPREDILPHAAAHMDVDGVAFFGGTVEEAKALEEASAGNLKRVHLFDDPEMGAWREDDMQSLYWIQPFLEWKTTWHPKGW